MIFPAYSIPSEADLTDSSTPAEMVMEKRRSTRVVRAYPITVIGVDALQEPFTENTSTVMVSCHGCKYQSTHYVPRGSIIELEIAATRRGAPPRRVTAKVIWVQRPRNAKDVLHVGLDFEVAGNVWDIPAPPHDWFPVPGEAEFSEPETDDAFAPWPDGRSLENEGAANNGGVTAEWDESEILSASKTSDVIEDDTTTEVETEAAGAVHIASRGPHVNGDIREMVERTVKAAVERLAKSLMEEARSERIAIAAQLDAKVQQAVEAAITRLPSLQLKKSKKRN
jgi:hypothetical protein